MSCSRAASDRATLPPAGTSSERRPAHSGRPCAGRFGELGRAAARFLDGLLRTQRYGKDQAATSAGLAGTYQHRTCGRPWNGRSAIGAYSYVAVERILAVQAQPKSVLETLAEQQRPHLAALLDSPVSRTASDRLPILVW